MSVIYVDGGYKNSCGTSKHKTDKLQDDRIERLESILDGSDGSVDNPEVLNALIQSNTEKITNNTSDIQSLNSKITEVENTIKNNTVIINGITISLDSIDAKIDKLNEKIDNLDTLGLSWVEVLNN